MGGARGIRSGIDPHPYPFMKPLIRIDHFSAKKGRRHRGPGPTECARRIKDWTRERLGLDADSTVWVTELRCSDPGCPDLETVIAIPIPSGDWRTLRIAKPVADVCREDISALT